MNKTALVTGGSHNIGQGIAIVLAEHGYDVAITYNSRKDGAVETQKEIESWAASASSTRRAWRSPRSRSRSWTRRTRTWAEGWT